MTEFTVNSQSISGQTCQYIAPFDNGYLIIAGLNALNYSPCLKYSTVFPLYHLNADWYETEFLGIYDAISQRVMAKGVDAALPGDICAPPTYFYDPYRFSLYNASMYKLAPLDAYVCNSQEVCSTPLDALLSAYNTSTQKTVDIDSTVCNSSEICYSPEASQNSSLTDDNNCEQYGSLFFIGMATGAASTLFLLAMGTCAYYAKQSLTKSHHVLPSDDQDATELTTSTSGTEVHV